MAQLEYLVYDGMVCLCLQEPDAHIKLGSDFYILVLLRQFPDEGGVVRADKRDV